MISTRAIARTGGWTGAAGGGPLCKDGNSTVVGSNLASTGPSLPSMIERSLIPGDVTAAEVRAGIGGGKPVEIIDISDDEEEEDAMIKLKKNHSLA